MKHNHAMSSSSCARSDTSTETSSDAPALFTWKSVSSTPEAKLRQQTQPAPPDLRKQPWKGYFPFKEQTAYILKYFCKP